MICDGDHHDQNDDDDYHQHHHYHNIEDGTDNNDNQFIMSDSIYFVFCAVHTSQTIDGQ